MNILQTIIEHKLAEIASAKQNLPEEHLLKSPFMKRPLVSLKESLTDKRLTGIIAEFKRASPSKGEIHPNAIIEPVIGGYARYGATGISVLTETKFFKGSIEDFCRARAAAPNVPLLRKDFIIDEYQILESKAIGADVILLIAACLSKERTAELAKYAHSLGLEVLLEIHDESELGHLNEHIDITGVNNRNLKDFTVDISISRKLSPLLPDYMPKISESGISHTDAITELKKSGFSGFLIGEHFMKVNNPVEAFCNFTHAISLKA